jgi:hypothetical protein
VSLGDFYLDAPPVGGCRHLGLAFGLAVTQLTLDDFNRADIGSAEDLQRHRPQYYVLNADYARAVPADTSWGQLITGLRDGTLGYRLVFRLRRDPPWPWLPGGHPDLVGARQETLVFSTLRNINPTIEIYEREPEGGGVASH